MTDTDFHVVWKDRVGLFDEWRRLIKECNAAYGTPGYPNQVHCLRINIINIKGDNAPKLRDEINDFDKKIYETFSNNNLPGDVDPAFYRYDDSLQEAQRAEMLFQFILQLLEDNGFISYQSKVEEDVMI